MVDECEYRDSHPEIEAQIESLGSRMDRLEQTIDNLKDERMTDFQKVIDKIGEVHEKVNQVAIKSEGQNGKLAMYGLLASVGGGLMLFIANRLFDHLGK